MIVPVVTGDLDAGAIDELIAICVRYHGIRAATPDPAGDPGTSDTRDDQAATMAEMLAGLEHQILAQVIQIVSGPGGVASFLRRNLLGKGLNGPSFPLDVGQTDDIPVHLRRLVALRDQGGLPVPRRILPLSTH